jgi:dolichol-phosphate mannosyltransferase
MPPARHNPFCSIVVPVFNEADNVGPLAERLAAVLESLNEPHEIVFVDDGSRDDTAARVRQLAERMPAVRLVRLSRNFGHQAALVAGMAAARADVVITLDGDLQHPPELIPDMVARYRAGAEVVQTIRRQPMDRSRLKRLTSRLFYRVLSRIASVRVTPGAADFRLMSREALNAFLACSERNRFNRGLVQWIGFEYCEMPYDAAQRGSGESKYSLRAMLRLAADAIFSFSGWPLRFAGLAGVVASVGAAAYLLFVLWARFFTDRAREGWSSILATVLILGGVQLIVLWIMGEYLSRLYDEAKQRPLFIVRRSPTAADEASAEALECPQDCTDQLAARDNSQ